MLSIHDLRICPKCSKLFQPYSAQSIYCSLRCKRAATATRRKVREGHKGEADRAQDAQYRPQADSDPAQAYSVPKVEPESRIGNPHAEELRSIFDDLAKAREKRKESTND